VDADQGGVVRVGVVEEQVDLALAQLALEAVEVSTEVGLHLGVRLGVEQLGEVAGVAGALEQAVPAGQFIADAAGRLGQLAGTARVVPERGIGDLALQLLEPGALAGKVKDAPEAG
jgi:hypothetical protein